ncbi:argininosuccinate lyase [Candidatus Methanomassiliicoccus intestinalis]|uniref:argininosuccinate lyase n=1 Tax=Candidatus Methanomassiliicoccus intestinalis TaxID=1406512 RepID=UPI0037DCF33A
MSSKKVLWSGRFKEGAADATLTFTSSLNTDVKLARYDVLGSIAHVKMLSAQGIISAADGKNIEQGLKEILTQIEDGTLPIQERLEDIHSNIEFILTDRIKDAGARLHTARSRNDQVVTDVRMFMRDAILEVVEELIGLEKTFLEVAKDNIDTIVPGFTHVQHAQPVTIGHHLLAHFARISRDVERFVEAYRRVNICPLGSAALAGTTYNIDREYTSSLLGFQHPCGNSMDGVSDRDFIAEFLFDASLCAVHLSSICEELVYWSSQEFAFIEMDDAYATGSSIMPQKKNSDVAELTRGRTGAAIGDLVNILTTMKGLPLTYNRDLQEDKDAVFASYERLTACIKMCSAMIATLTFNKERMLNAAEEGFMNATDLADYLVVKGMPFRKAHEVVGGAVRYCIDHQKKLDDLTLSELKTFSELIDKDVFEILPLDKCVYRRKSLGGTSPEIIPVQLDNGYSIVDRQNAFVSGERNMIEQAFEALEK